MHSQQSECHRDPDNVDPSRTGTPGDDAAVIERARAGDEAAFRELVHGHHEHVWRIVWRIVGDDRIAEEVVQEVFLAAQQALPGLRQESCFPTWLRQIAMSRALQSAAPRRNPRTGAEQEASDASLFQSCFETLDGSLRAPIALKLEGLSYEEIAKALDLPLGTVRSRLFLARDAMGKYLRRKRGAS